MKKNQSGRVDSCFPPHLTKILRVMKLSVLLTCFLSLNLMASVYSQQARFDLDVKDQSVRDILKTIEKESLFRFFYNDEFTDLDKKLTFSTTGKSIDDLMVLVLDNTEVSYKVLDNNFVVITPKSLIQERQVTGIVTNENGNPMPGVNIQVKGTTAGAITDSNGRYSITVTDPTAKLIFSFIGYSTLEVPIGGKSVMSITLQPDLLSLEEVVVIGYGTMRKSSVTAAISKVEDPRLAQMPASRIETSLVGRMAGVNISTLRTVPGEAPIIRIRGIGSISAGNDPLVVIDGFAGGSLDQLNVNDIQSIEVLKDASSAAIYGSRGSGGIIIVTTKRGKTGSPKIKVNTYAGLSVPYLYDDWLTGQEWYDYLARYYNREFVWAGGDPSIPMWGDPRRPSRYQLDPVALSETQTIWQDVILNNAPIQSYNLSVSGGTEFVKYYVSGTYSDEDGVVITSNYKNYSLRANVDIKVNKLIDMGVMFNPSYRIKRDAPGSMNYYIKYPNFVEPQLPDGTYPRADSYTALATTMDNPLATFIKTINKSRVLNNLGEVYINLNLLEGLRFRTSFGATLYNSSYDSFSDVNRRTNGSAYSTNTNNLLNENTLTYSRIFNKIHEFNGLLGASFQRSNTRSLGMAATTNSYNNTIILTLNNAIINPTSTYSSKTQWGLISYFARANYAYREKYLFSASVRRDGCSRFGADNKWGYFPSASVAWRVSKEGFMQNIPVISELKIRGSYGVTGNYNIGDFDYLGKVTSNNYSPNDVLVKSMAQTSFENSNLGWEKTISYDIGLELGLLKNRLNIVFDYYDKKTSSLLYSVSIPAITGFTTTISNIGEIGNKGIEFEIKSVNLNGPFRWQTSFNLTRNRNKVLSLGSVTERIRTMGVGMNYLLRVGEPMFSYYSYKTIGVLLNDEDLANSPHLTGEMVGHPKYLDANGDGQITPEKDRVILGNFQPKLVMGMTNDLAWKNFDLTLTFQSALGFKVLNVDNSDYEGSTTMPAIRRGLVENQWWSTAEPGDGKTPGPGQYSSQGFRCIDKFLDNGSYCYLRNLNFGYTLPGDLTRKIGIDNLRIYTSMNNLFLIKDKKNLSWNVEGYTGGEVTGISSYPGYNWGTEPVSRVITIGLNVSF